MIEIDYNSYDERWKESSSVCSHFETEFKSLHDFLSQASKKKSRKTLEKWLEKQNIYPHGDSGIVRIIVLGWIFGVPSDLDIEELEQEMAEAEDPDNWEDPDYYNPLDQREAWDHSVNVIMELLKDPSLISPPLTS